jgi:hypothetical protein
MILENSMLFDNVLLVGLSLNKVFYIGAIHNGLE